MTRFTPKNSLFSDGRKSCVISYSGKLNRRQHQKRRDARMQVQLNPRAQEVLKRMAGGATMKSYQKTFQRYADIYWSNERKTAGKDGLMVELLHSAGYVDLEDDYIEEGIYHVNNSGLAYLRGLQNS